mgnify:CR=1 FL=1
MTPAEAAVLLGRAAGTIREYCQLVGIPKVKGRYDIPPETVEDWRYCPPSVRAARNGHGVEPDPLDGPPIKTHVHDRVFGSRQAREARRRRLLEAVEKAGL